MKIEGEVSSFEAYAGGGEEYKSMFKEGSEDLYSSLSLTIYDLVDSGQVI